MEACLYGLKPQTEETEINWRNIIKSVCVFMILLFYFVLCEPKLNLKFTSTVLISKVWIKEIKKKNKKTICRLTSKQSIIKYMISRISICWRFFFQMLDIYSHLKEWLENLFYPKIQIYLKSIYYRRHSLVESVLAY